VKKILTVRVDSSLPLPVKKYKGDIGFDIVAVERTLLSPGHGGLVRSNHRFILPPGTWADVRGRSGLSVKGIWVATGLIDTNYRGVVGVVMMNLSNRIFAIDPGDRIAQVVFMPDPDIQLEEISPDDSRLTEDTSRGEAGFGSTGIR
jgi:dUTP pyrophosphatase